MCQYGEGRKSKNGLVAGRLPEAPGGGQWNYSKQAPLTHKLQVGFETCRPACFPAALKHTHTQTHTDERRLRWIVAGMGVPRVCVSVAQKWINEGKK